MKPTAVNLLNSANLRQTQPRVAILNVLLAAGEPVTQEQIADSIGPSTPNKTTIYRTLMNLVEKNLVHKAYLENRTWHFELAHHCSEHQCHPHFTCSQCRQTKCLTGISATLVDLPEGFEMHRQQIHVEGVCPKCRR